MLHGADWLSELSIPECAESGPEADLRVRDDEARSVQNWAIATAIAEGGAAGWFGIFSAPIDIPAVIMLSLRTVRRIGLCYGYSGTDEHEREFVLSVLGSAGANTMAEKMVSMHTLACVNQLVAKQAFKHMAEQAAAVPISKEAAIIVLRDLAKQIGVNLTKRKMLAAIPAIGAVVGASLNGWYLRDVGIAAECAHKERQLRDQGLIIDMEGG